MATFNTPLGMNVKNNPIKESRFVMNAQIGDDPLPGGLDALLTEGGDFIMTEGGDFITTE